MNKKEAVERIDKMNLIEFIEKMAISPSSKEALKIACEELKKNEKNN